MSEMSLSVSKSPPVGVKRSVNAPMSGLDNNFGTSAVLFVSLISTSAKFVNFAVVVDILIDLPF